MNKVVLFSVLFLSIAFAAPMPANTHEALNYVGEYVDLYNQNVGQVPDFVKSIVGNERVNIEITRLSGEVTTLGAVMSDSRIISYNAYGGVNNPTLKIIANEADLNQILASADPATVAMDAYKTGKISYHGVDVVSAIKFTVIDIAAKLFGGFFGF